MAANGGIGRKPRHGVNEAIRRNGERRKWRNVAAWRWRMKSISNCWRSNRKLGVVSAEISMAKANHRNQSKAKSIGESESILRGQAENVEIVM
jgi:hypothetical protein